MLIKIGPYTIKNLSVNKDCWILFKGPTNLLGYKTSGDLDHITRIFTLKVYKDQLYKNK